MSTHAIIAYPLEGMPWRRKGVYSHWGGQLDDLGKRIWDWIHQELGKGTPLKDIATWPVVCHPTGFSNFPDDCYCHTKKEGVDESQIFELSMDENPEGRLYVINYITNCLDYYGPQGSISCSLNESEPNWRSLEQNSWKLSPFD